MTSILEEDLPLPRTIWRIGHFIDCIAFPLLLVVSTYVLTWLRFKLEKVATMTILFLLAMSGIRFIEVVVFGSEKDGFGTKSHLTNAIL
jgi:hypothetical protein